MNEIAQLAEQAQLLIHQHISPNLLSRAVPIAIGLMLLGIGVSVLGAKMAKFLVTGTFIVLGAVVGYQFGGLIHATPALFALVGAAMVGTIGFLTFRIWVGAMAAAVVGTVALGAFSNHHILPHLADFQEQRAELNAVSDTGFEIPTAQEQAAYQQRDLRQWWSDLWAFVTSRDPSARQLGQAVGLGSLVTGLLFGLVATRATIIVATSLFGTFCLISAMATMLGTLSPSMYQSLLHRPGAAGFAAAGFLATSLVLQTLLTRKAAVADSTAPPKSK